MNTSIVNKFGLFVARMSVAYGQVGMIIGLITSISSLATFYAVSAKYMIPLSVYLLIIAGIIIPVLAFVLTVGVKAQFELLNKESAISQILIELQELQKELKSIRENMPK